MNTVPYKKCGAVFFFAPHQRDLRSLYMNILRIMSYILVKKITVIFTDYVIMFVCERNIKFINFTV